MANMLKLKLRIYREKSWWLRSPQIDDRCQETNESLPRTYQRQLPYKSSNLGPHTTQLTHHHTALPDSEDTFQPVFTLLLFLYFLSFWWVSFVSCFLILASSRFAIKFCTPSIHWDAVLPTSLVSFRSQFARTPQSHGSLSVQLRY